MEQFSSQKRNPASGLLMKAWRSIFVAVGLVTLFGVGAAQAASYCLPTHAGTANISNVTFNTLSHSPSGPNSPVSLFTGSTTTVNPGAAYTLSVTCDGGAIISVWFDWNRDTVFSASEWTQITTGSTANVANTVSITVPSGTAPGLMRMRVRSRLTGNQNGSGDACLTMGSGSGWDYNITVTNPLPACTGAPTAGNIFGAGTFCPASLPTLSLSGYSQGTTFQWQSSTDTTQFANNITGATTGSYSTVGQAADSLWYRVSVTCTASSQVAQTAWVKVKKSSFINCYCTATSTFTTDGDNIGQVTFGSFANPTVTPSACTNTGIVNNYTNFANLGAINVQRTITFPLSVYQVNDLGSFNTYVNAFIDWNQDGTFDASETYNVGASAACSTNTVNITVPVGAVLGNTKMRIVMQEGGTATTTLACGSFTYGEVEDYLINVQAAPVCTAPPAAGTITQSLSSVCAGSSTNLVLTGQTLGSTIQWESSSNGTTWSAIPGAIYSFFNTGAINSATYYRAAVTCSGNTQYATAVQITLNAFNSCYCIPQHYYACQTFTSYIGNVTLNTLNNTSLCTSTNGSSYTKYAATGTQTTTLYKNTSFQLNVTVQQVAAGVGAWIDYDHSGTFDASEFISLPDATTPGTAVNASFIVPTSSLTGATGLRIRTNYTGSVTSGNACTLFYDGESEDYTVDIQGVPPCTTPPTAGTITGPSSVCAGNTASLVLTGYSLGTTLQWQASTNGTTWATIPGATSGFYATSAINATTYYRVQVTCLGNTQTTPALQIGLSSFVNCYCTPQHYYACSSTYGVINNVIFNTLSNLNSGCTGVNGNSWTAYTAAQYTTTAYKGQQYQLSVTTTQPNTIAAWIDYNQSGTFDAGELTTVTSSSVANTASTSVITIPATALTGNTGMRIRTTYTFTTPDPCALFYAGETEDYVINIQPVPPCTQPPSAGTVTASLNSVCSGGASTLTASGYTLGTTLQWQSSPDSITWNNITGATNSFYNATGITAVTYYRVAVTCSGSTSNSPGKKISMNAFYYCYCTSAASSNADDDIGRVTVGTFNNPATAPTPCTSNSSSNNTYSNFTGLGPIVMQQQVTYPASVYQINQFGSYGTYAKMWIDWNRNGVFTDAGEQVLGGALAACSTLTGSITVPANAQLGLTGMRVVLVEGGTATSVQPCATYTWGETEDYLVDIQAPPPCVGTPTAGAITATPTSVCSGGSTTLVLTGFTLGTTINWETSPDSVTWTAVSGAVNSNYTPTNITAATYYRAAVTCSGQTTYTAGVKVTLNSFYLCYCTSNATNQFYSDIGRVIFGTFSNPAVAPACSGNTSMTNTYTNFTGLTGLTAYQGQAISASVLNANYYTFQYAGWAKVWIDWNQNGVFTDAGEEVLSGASAAGCSTLTGTIIVPNNATLGTTGLRVVLSNGATSTLSPCGTYTYGETEDYLINITAPPPCTAPPTPGSISTATANVCPSGSTNITLTGQGIGTTLQWEMSTTSSSSGFSAITGATNAVYTVAGSGLTGTTYYRVAVTCSGQTAYTNAQTITLNSFLSCYCTSNATSTADDDIGQVTFGTYSFPATTPTPCTNNSSSTGTYTNNSALGPINVQRTVPYNVGVYQINQFGSYTTYTKVFIDWNQNGVLNDAGEEFLMGNNTACNTVTQSITVPATATLGNTRMRVVLVEGGSSTSVLPCGTYTWGETEDYTINVQAAPTCPQPPTAGTIAGNSTACVGATTTYTATGYSLGTSLQWQSSTNGTTYTDISGANGGSYTAPALVAGTTTYYRLKVVCGATNATTNSITRTQAAFYNCYCTSAASSTADDDIGQVTIKTTSNPATLPTPCTNNAASNKTYTNFTNLTPVNIYQTETFPVSVYQINQFGSYGTYAKMWIDWNQNGVFTDAGEEVLGGSLAACSTLTGSVTVPATALTGITGVRVALVESGTSTSVQPCATYTWGETEDYLVNVLAPPPCTVPPTAGTIGGNSLICINGNTGTTLTLTGQTLGTTLQWQSSTDSLTWGTISGATSPSYATGALTGNMFYRVAVTCSGTTVYTTVRKVTVGIAACYCIPTHTYACTYTYISNVAFNTLNNTTACANGYAQAYTQYSATGAQTTNVYAGLTYPLSVTTNTAQRVGVWIDYNRDGVYSTSEYTSVSTASLANVASTVNIAVPATAQAGLTGMRVRCEYTFYTLTSSSACSALLYGETEDYLINIQAQPVCSGAPTAGSITGQSTVCTGTTQTLQLAGWTLGTTLQWETSTDGITYNAIFNATSQFYQTPSATITRWYRVAVTCGANTSYTNPLQVSIYTPVYASLPYSTSFESSWTSQCGTNDRPGVNWIVNPYTGTNSWRRNDQGTSANWVSGTNGAYSPNASNGTYSARFHTYEAGTTAGSMLLYVNLSQTGTKQLTFDYLNTSGTDKVDVYLSLDGGTTFGPSLGTATTAASWTSQTVILGNYQSATAVVKLTATGDFSYTDLGIDNVLVKVLANNDFGVTAIVAPAGNGCGLSANAPVTIKVKNLGGNVVAAGTVIPVRMRVNNGAWVQENLTLTSALAINGTVNYTFAATANLSTPGSYVIYARTFYNGDGDYTNDNFSNAGTPIISSPSVASLPYFNNFESVSNSQYWMSSKRPGAAATSNNSWVLGTPAKATLTGAHSGTKAWVVGPLNGQYPNNENSVVMGPCFNFSGLTTAPFLSMWVWWDSETSWDGAVLQTSIDGGTTWTRVGNQNDPDSWYNGTFNANPGGQATTPGQGWGGSGTASSNGWRFVQHQLPANVANASNVLIRIAFASDGSVQGNGFAFDDLAIATQPATTQLRSSDCGYMQFTRRAGRNYIIADAVPNVQQYEFTFTPVAGGNAVTYTSNYNLIQIGGLTGVNLAYGTSYNAKVRTIQDRVKSTTGSTCMIGLVPNPNAAAGVPSTQVRSTDCNRYNYGLVNDYIGADFVAGATKYDFEFTDLVSSAQSNVMNSTSRFILLSTAAPALQYGHTYSVRVRATVDTVVGSYGSICIIGIVPSGTPTATSLRAYDCGRTNVSPSGYVAANIVPAADSYTFNFYSNAAATALVASVNQVSPWLQLAPLGLNIGSTYWVTVSSTLDGNTSAILDTCTLSIDTINGGNRLVGAVEGSTVASINAYPNPFDRDVTIAVAAPGYSSVSYQLFDLSGRTVSSRTTIANEQLVTVGSNLAPGVYVVRVYGDGSELGHLRLVKSGR